MQIVDLDVAFDWICPMEALPIGAYQVGHIIDLESKRDRETVVIIRGIHIPGVYFTQYSTY